VGDPMALVGNFMKRDMGSGSFIRNKVNKYQNTRLLDYHNPNP
jgi:hypothetical protein